MLPKPGPPSARIALALALAFSLLSAGPALAQGNPLQTLQRAEDLYKADRLLEAEKLYRLALETVAESDKARCYDRLLSVYVRVGRLDRALNLAARYEDWLRERQSDARRR